MTYISPKS